MPSAQSRYSVTRSMASTRTMLLPRITWKPHRSMNKTKRGGRLHHRQPNSSYSPPCQCYCVCRLCTLRPNHRWRHSWTDQIHVKYPQPYGHRSVSASYVCPWTWARGKVSAAVVENITSKCVALDLFGRTYFFNSGGCVFDMVMDTS